MEEFCYCQRLVIFKKYPYKIAKNTPNHCEINVKGSKRRKEEQAPQPTFPREKVGWGACSSYSFGTQAPWHASLKFFRDTGAQSQNLADTIIKAQNDIIQQVDQYIATYNATSNDSEENKSNRVFLIHLIRDLLHPDPSIRLSADQGIARIKGSYKIE